MGDKIKKLGLFGGTFDPIHTGHLIVAELIREALNLEWIIFVPAKKHPFKNNHFIANETHRLKMIERAISKNENMRASDIEIKSDEVSYTIETIKKIRKEYPSNHWDIYFLMGMDNLSQFHLWRDPDTLVKMCKIVVFSRPGFASTQKVSKYLPYIQIVQIPLLEISSTQIRNRVKNGQTIRYLVPPEVESYIVANKLYAS